MRETLFLPSHDPAIGRVNEAIYDALLNRPGQYPFTRGIHPDMYTRGNIPTVRKYGGFGTGQELNAYLRDQIANGVTGLSIAFDLPTQTGLDPDHPLSKGEVGVTGVSIAALKDYEDTFAGILPQIASKGIGVSMTINATAPILLAFYVAAAKRQGIDPRNLRGTIQNDVLKEYLARNTFIYPLDGTLRLARDVFSWSKENLPRFNTISICGYHMREKGCTASQELAFMFSNAVQYLCAAVKGGLKAEDIAGQFSFFINVKKNFFEEIAKLRASRRIWAQIIKEGFGISSERCQKLRMQSYTGGSDLISQKPQLNIVRDAVRTLAAVLGGTQGTNTTSFDEAITIPTQLSQQIAIDIPYIVLLEKSLSETVDPLGGSYYLETLTNKIETEVWIHLAEIVQASSYQKALAGMLRDIEDESYKETKSTEAGDKKIAGLNEAMDKESLYPPVPIFHAPGDPEKREQKRIEQIQKFRQHRDQQNASKSLEYLKNSAYDPDENLMPALINAVEQGSTIGEISDTLREIFGTARLESPWEPSAKVEVFSNDLRLYIKRKSAQASRTANLSTPQICQASNMVYVQEVQSANSKEPGRYPYMRGLNKYPKFWQKMSHGKKMPGHLTKNILADAGHYHQKGADAAQEIAFAINDALRSPQFKTVKEPCIIFLSGKHFFEEWAKFRAARALWALWAQRALGLDVATDPRLKLRLYAKTCAHCFVKEKPWNNITRAALESLQGVLANVEFLEIPPFDAPFRNKNQRTEWSAWAEQIAQDTHAVIEYEIGLDQAPADPGAGSFYLESLTQDIIEKASKMLLQLETLESGPAQSYISDSLNKSNEHLSNGSIKAPAMVGVTIQTKGPNPQPKIIKKARATS